MASEKVPRRLRRRRKKEGKVVEVKKKKKKKRSWKSLIPFSLLKKADDKKNLKRETTALAIKEVSKFKEKQGRYPKQDEMDKIADNIYEQLKEKYEREERAERERKEQKRAKARELSFLERRRRGREAAEEPAVEEKGVEPLEKEEPKEETLLERRRRLREEKVEAKKEIPSTREEPLIKPEEVDKISIEGLFEKEASEKPLEETGEDELSLLEISESEETAPAEGDLNLISDDAETITKEFETEKNKCPNCGNKTEDIIFCPVCGSGFCTHCAEKVEVLEDRIKYTCPKCKGEFKVKKH